jgi:PIN domain nuclease of toxin-antitoxin system
VKRALVSPENEIWLSPISVWEALVLAEKGRLSLEGDAQAWVVRALDRMPVREAPISFDIASESRRLSLSHDDPADRFLAATARVLELTLVTADRRLLKAKGLAVLPND